MTTKGYLCTWKKSKSCFKMFKINLLFIISCFSHNYNNYTQYFNIYLITPIYLTSASRSSIARPLFKYVLPLVQ